MQDGERVGEKGLSAQPPPPFRAHVLQSAKGRGATRGYSRTLKCEHHENLHDGNG